MSSITQTGVTWAKANSYNYSGQLAEIWYGAVTSSSASTTITVLLNYTIQNAYGVANVCEYSGLQGTVTVDLTAYTYAAPSTTTSTGTPTTSTTEDKELCIGAIFGLTNGGASVAQSNPQYDFALLDGLDNNYSGMRTSLAYLEKIVTSKLVPHSGTTVTQTMNWTGCLATFKVSTVTITATEDANTTISPSNVVTVVVGDDQTFTIAANSGYHIAHVYVDYVDQGAISTYTFNDVVAAHTIFATSESDLDSYDLTAVADTHSTISPSGTVNVDAGDDQEFTITANSGYHVTHVYVDYVDQGAISTYTFTDVATDHAIFVTSENDASAIDVNGDLVVDGNAAISGAITVAGDLQATGYKASDGTEGATSDVTLSAVTVLHFKNGLLVGAS